LSEGLRRAEEAHPHASRDRCGAAPDAAQPLDGDQALEADADSAEDAPRRPRPRRLSQAAPAASGERSRDGFAGVGEHRFAVHNQVEPLAALDREPRCW
jgi:hypothetical protein